MPDSLDKFLGEIDRAKLRVKRPSKFVFLCGGVILQGDAAPANLRDFIWRTKGIGTKGTSYVLAESAQQLYRDSGYNDLITFEEDIARIAAVVLVISESAGSLAELGAFCSNPVINPVLRILISEANFNQESFIRWGPVERILRPNNRERVGVYPWVITANGLIVPESIEPHFAEIEDFINEHVGAAASTMQYPLDHEVAQFYDIMWAIYLADAITPNRLLETVKRVHPDLTAGSLRRKLYSLRVANWIEMIPYGGQDYYFLPTQEDPFQYGFREGTVDKEPLRRVLAVRGELFSKVPEGALVRVRDAREPAQ